MRKIEYSLIGIVAVFTALVLPILNKEHKMDFGNTSDICNALSAFGTFCIALVAFRKAPEWLSQKIDEKSLDIGVHINNHIKNSLFDATRSINGYDVKSTKSKMIYELYYYHYFKPETSKDKTDFDKIRTSRNIEFDDYVVHGRGKPAITIQVEKLTTQIDKLNLLNWDFTPKKKKIISDIIKLAENIDKNESEIYFSIASLHNRSEGKILIGKTSISIISEFLSLSPKIREYEKQNSRIAFEILNKIKEYNSGPKSYRNFFQRIF